MAQATARILDSTCAHCTCGDLYLRSAASISLATVDCRRHIRPCSLGCPHAQWSLARCRPSRVGWRCNVASPPWFRSRRRLLRKGGGSPPPHMRPHPDARRMDIALVELRGNGVVARCPGPHDLINDRADIGCKTAAGLARRCPRFLAPCSAAWWRGAGLLLLLANLPRCVTT
jgi:hypothetical protein